MTLASKISFGLLSLTLAFSGCNSTRPSASDNTVSKSSMMIQEGFSKASVLEKESGECAYLIQLDQETTLYDPINLQGDFQKADAPIWVKFERLRQMSRCPNTVPVRIQEIKKREE